MELVLLGKNEQVLAFSWFLAHAETSVVQKIERMHLKSFKFVFKYELPSKWNLLCI